MPLCHHLQGERVRLRAIENETGEVVGDLTTHHCDARVGSFSYSITIRREHRRHGYAAEAIALVLRNSWKELRIRKRR
jgi:RimJ/RimL family protein N-acetyltransferase